ncbi:hypothetical protein BS78_05G202600 [Paspalum vaginatum]|nr:hypothetical protein BS78_05G202600 [Paspalum vaginatum]
MWDALLSGLSSSPTPLVIPAPTAPSPLSPTSSSDALPSTPPGRMQDALLPAPLGRAAAPSRPRLDTPSAALPGRVQDAPPPPSPGRVQDAPPPPRPAARRMRRRWPLPAVHRTRCYWPFPAARRTLLCRRPCLDAPLLARARPPQDAPPPVLASHTRRSHCLYAMEKNEEGTRKKQENPSPSSPAPPTTTTVTRPPPRHGGARSGSCATSATGSTLLLSQGPRLPRQQRRHLIPQRVPRFGLPHQREALSRLPRSGRSSAMPPTTPTRDGGVDAADYGRQGKDQRGRLGAAEQDIVTPGCL